MTGGYPRPAGRGRGRDKTLAAWSLLLVLALGCGGLARFLRPGGSAQDSWEAVPREEVRRIALRHRAARLENGLVEMAPLVASGKDVSYFPSAKDSTIMFLHVFKCAGTSLRQVFMSWAEQNGWSGAIVSECKANSKALTQADRVCLNERNDLIDIATQKWQVAEKKVLAGHFIWNFDQYATPPHLIVTTLRNPLELFVSSQQFKHRTETQTLEEAAQFVARAMLSRLE